MSSVINLAVAFGGAGTAVTAARSDHTHAVGNEIPRAPDEAAPSAPDSVPQKPRERERERERERDADGLRLPCRVTVLSVRHVVDQLRPRDGPEVA